MLGGRYRASVKFQNQLLIVKCKILIIANLTISQTTKKQNNI